MPNSVDSDEVLLAAASHLVLLFLLGIITDFLERNTMYFEHYNP